MGKYVSTLNAVRLTDLAKVGGKGACLGEMIGAGFPVPSGFCIKSVGFEVLLDAADLRGTIRDISASIDFESLQDIEGKTACIREIISTAPVPGDVEAEIREACGWLQGEIGATPVAVRSSVATRDLSRSSFPGQMDTFHNVSGVEEVLAAVRNCWASVWSARAAATSHALHIDPENIMIAPVVQAMVASDVSGVLFTANPVNGDRQEMLLDAAFGLGEAVVSGSVTPDHYVLSRKDLRVITRAVGLKRFKWEFDVEKGRGNRRVVLPDGEANRECLSSGQLREVAMSGIAVEEHFGEPQDVEWAYSGGRLFLLQARKIGGLSRGP